MRATSAVDRDLARTLAISLLRFSETRGREAVGIAVHDGERHRGPQAGRLGHRVPREPEAPRSCSIARSRATTAPSGKAPRSRSPATRGSRPTAPRSNVDNNQPVITHGAVALHNGIIVNDARSPTRYPQLDAHGRARQRGARRAAAHEARRARAISSTATRATFAEIEGSASIAMLFDDLDVMLLATNTGSLFQLTSESRHGRSRSRRSASSCSASSRTRTLGARLGDCRLEQIRAGHALAIHLDGLRRHAFSLAPRRRRAAARPTSRRTATPSRSSITRSRARSAEALHEVHPARDLSVRRLRRARRVPLLPHVEDDPAQGRAGAARCGRAVSQQGRQPRRDRRVLAAAATRPTACTT